MSISFASPSYRAASNDLTINVAPLGLVELSDEEFEMHGPRLNRYAHNWAFYLGMHWGYRRELGEPQLTFNYVKAMADFINNFTFARGIEFRTSHETEHIVPAILKTVWEEDNNKEQLLWEMGNQGGVSGDCFVKVAWEPDETLPNGGRVRILILNSQFCFPEWAPHDRTRLMRFKMKYRFYGVTPEGTKQIFTYTEILTDDYIEEYLNDELIDQRENPLGVIPVAHIPNIPVSGSPWGLADIQDITSINREFNEKATDISDIINYHASPITIISGAKANNLEKGAKKVWGGIPHNAKVYNLENGVNLEGPQAYLDRLKESMHELTGVPEGALGKMQPISNTSGVALSLMYQPMMQRYNLKKIQYTVGIKRINEFALKTVAVFSPDLFIYDPDTQGIKEEDQPEELDLQDPLTYQTVINWPPPLPVDKLIKLNEIQQMMALGLESRRGALRDLGVEFPDEKLQEIFVESIADTKADGAQILIKNLINKAILDITGLPPEGVDMPIPELSISRPIQDNPMASPGGGEGGDGPGSGGPGIDVLTGTPEQLMNIINEITTAAYGTKIPQRRNPDNDKN